MNTREKLDKIARRLQHISEHDHDAHVNYQRDSLGNFSIKYIPCSICYPEEK